MMTPLAIEVLLHCHCCPEPWPHPSPASAMETQSLLSEGLIVRDERSDDLYYRTTPRGQALVAMLCATPLPEQVFVDPRVWNKSLGAAPPLKPLEMRCLHCHQLLTHHSHATDECMDGSGKHFQPMP